jgi:hypothetical protein
MSNALTTLGLGVRMLVVFTLLCCSACTPATEPERTSCELNLNTVCAIAIENYAAAHAVRCTQPEPADGAHLVPLVVAVAPTSGTAEVDCYVSTDTKGPWLVYARETVVLSQNLNTDVLMSPPRIEMDAMEPSFWGRRKSGAFLPNERCVRTWL